MMNMNLLAAVAPPYIYHDWPFWKMFWEVNFTGEEKFRLREFTDVNMKNCGRCNVRRYREIKGSDKYVTLDILLKFDSLNNMKITSSESKDDLGRSGKGLITSLGLKVKSSPNK